MAVDAPLCTLHFIKEGFMMKLPIIIGVAALIGVLWFMKSQPEPARGIAPMV